MELDADTLRLPAIDKDLQPALDAFAATAQDSGELTEEALRGIRAMLAAVARTPDEELGRNVGFTVEHRQAPGLHGAPDVPLLVFRPARIAAPTGCLVWIHGGGMIFGSYRDGLAELLDYAAAAGAVLVSVEYRLAPETPHPGPVEDCYAALSWVAAHTDQLHVPPDRLIVVGGSAGGGLAAGAVLMAHDEGTPRIHGQMLLAPMLDHRSNTTSMRQLGAVAVWTRQANQFGWSRLLGPLTAADQVSPLASPARRVDLSGLPQSYVDVGTADGFRDEDADYALRLARDGNLVELHLWPGGYHGFEGMAPDAAISRAAIVARATWICRLLDPSDASDGLDRDPAPRRSVPSRTSSINATTVV